MFKEENCDRCGVCLSLCPFLEMPIDLAKEEFSKLIETRFSDMVSKSCADCSYCDVICPGKANPSYLIKEMRLERSKTEGLTCMALLTEEVPVNFMSVGLGVDTAEKEKNLEIYGNPYESAEVFHVGCSLSYIHTDLAKTKLLEGLPIVGGLKYCCGGYVNGSFGREEAKIKGRALYAELKNTGVEKVISFCPGCERMTRGVYPEILEEYDIESQNISEYLIEKHGKGQIDFSNRLDLTVTVHDPCPWRQLDEKIYEGPRKLLELMGASVVEMKHNRRESLCCAAPVAGRDPDLAASIMDQRISEAIESGAEAIAISCTGCFSIANQAAKRNIETYYITELAQMALGEKPPHRVLEVGARHRAQLVKTISENPQLLADKYIIKNGKVLKI